MKLLKQSTATTVIMGPFVDKTDMLNAETGLSTQTGRLNKNASGASFTASSWAHDANGFYVVGLSTAHTNTLGLLHLQFTDAATYLPVWDTFTVVPAEVYDTLVSGTDHFTADLSATATGDVVDAIDADSTQLAAIVAALATIDAALAGLTTFSSDIADILANTQTIMADVADILTATGSTAGGADMSAIPWNTAWNSYVNAQVLDVLNTDTFDEPGQEAPGSNITLVKKLGYLYKDWRNKKIQGSDSLELYNAAGTTVDQKSTYTDSGVTATRGVKQSGP